MKSLLRLFKAVEIQNHKKKDTDEEILYMTVQKGFVFTPEVIANYTRKDLLSLIDNIDVILTPEQLNNSFHKSWKKIKDVSIEQLVAEQIVHYFTTYGFESLGIHDYNSVYIPNEKLDLPTVNDSFNLTIIHGFTKDDIKEKLLSLLKSGVALHEDTIKDVVSVSKRVGIHQTDVKDIRNKEVLVHLSDELGLFPENPVEFLRYLIFKATGKTLLIKNEATFEGIKECENKKEIYNLFIKYKKEYGLGKLAEIFLRFKPIFLAFKSNELLKPTINKLRKLAIKCHKPMPIDYLNNITSMIKNEVKIEGDILVNELNKVNTFRKIRLAYALKYRTKNPDSILYKIRNGKGYATEFSFENKKEASRVLKVVLESIVKDLEKNVNGKKVFIPDYINYTLPATEKQFTGMIPSGSYVTISNDIIVGINWDDVGEQRVDLDLSMLDSTGKYGWDSYYRDEDRSILFSGDMTDARRGATELFYVKKQSKKEYIMFVNYYNYDSDIEVPFKIVVAREKAVDFKKNYMANPDNVIATTSSKINDRQKILGLLITTTGESRFYFAETNIGNSITAGDSEYVEQSRKYLFNFYQNTISLNSLFKEAGAVMVDSTEDCDIDLSVESLDKSTIINLLT